jgi:hypothetical protein
MMNLTNTLIRGRETAIHSIFRISSNEVFNPSPCPNPPPSNAEIASQLKQAVNSFKQDAMDSDGLVVDYSKIEHSSDFKYFTEDLIPQLHHFDHSVNSDPKAATSFWINLYNALVIHAVIAFKVESSVNENGLGGMVRFFRGAAYQVGDLRFSLEDIEHGVLRNNSGNPLQFSPQFPSDDPRIRCALDIDPRIHFALNCASRSCPPIGVYSTDKLDVQLDLASRNYVGQETRLLGDKFQISKLFDWYKTDFGGKLGVRDFLLRYLPDDERREFLLKDQIRFNFSPYDWGLNI